MTDFDPEDNLHEVERHLFGDDEADRRWDETNPPLFKINFDDMTCGHGYRLYTCPTCRTNLGKYAGME